MGIPLVIAEPTGRYNRMLRRFTFKDRSAPCPVTAWGHSAHVYIEEIDEAQHERVRGDNWPHDDTRWPTTCEKCGYVFVDTDEWQRSDNRILRLPDGTELTMWSSFGMYAPPGTMVRATWYDEFSHHPAGIESWLISLPDGGEWITSQKATDGAYWNVTGTPPNITATQSIWHNAPKGWHGFVRNGELVSA